MRLKDGMAVSDIQAKLAVIEGDNPPGNQSHKVNGKKRVLSRSCAKSAKSAKPKEASVKSKIRRVKDTLDD